MNYFTACGIYHAEVEAMLRAVDQVDIGAAIQIYPNFANVGLAVAKVQLIASCRVGDPNAERLEQYRGIHIVLKRGVGGHGDRGGGNQPLK